MKDGIIRVFIQQDHLGGLMRVSEKIGLNIKHCIAFVNTFTYNSFREGVNINGKNNEFIY